MSGCVFCNEPIPDGQRVCRECMIQRTPIHAKDKKSAILDHLRKHHIGMRNAVHSAELERLFSLDDRAVRRKISALRKEGYPICSGDMGYYYAENQKDINSTVGRLNDLMTGVSDARTGLLFSRFPEPVMTVRVTVMMNGGEL